MTPASTLARPATARRVFQVAYSNAGDLDETPRLHHMRDGAAMLELMAALAPHGYAYETALHFYPNKPRRDEKFTFLRPDDVLVVTTRPPIEVKLQKGIIPFVKGLRHSQNRLENSIFEAIAPFFHLVGRNAIDLSRRAAGWLREDARDHAALEFTRHSHALICGHGMHGTHASYLTTVHSKRRHTAGYFIKLGKIPRYPCGLVCCFAPGGVENLLFSRLVRRCHAEWLAPEWEGFCFVRFNVPAEAEDTPLSAADFDGDIVESVLAEHTFAPASASAAKRASAGRK